MMPAESRFEMGLSYSRTAGTQAQVEAFDPHEPRDPPMRFLKKYMPDAKGPTWPWAITERFSENKASS